MITFKIMEGGDKIPPCHMHIIYHLIFDAKMKRFGHEARFFAQGNMTETHVT